MYFYIQEIEMKRKTKGSSKEILLGTKNIDGILVNTYAFSEECFERPIKKSYQITLHESYRENGKIKKRQYVVAHLNYYDIAESCEDEHYAFEDTLYCRLFDKLDLIIKTFDIQEDKKDDFIDNLYDSFATKIDPLFSEIRKEFMETEEGKIFLKYKKIFYDYESAKRKFLSEHDAFSQEYDICFDLYGNLTNELYLEKIRRRKSDQKKEYRNYNSSRKIYTTNQRKMLRQFYRILVKTFHPDSNIGKDTSEQMKFLNKIKEEWGL